MFPEEVVANMRAELATLPRKAHRLHEGFLQHEFTQARAKEFAHHGFVRRLNTLARCTLNAFNLISPDVEARPPKDTRNDAEINIQAAFFSAFGAVDNLAWVWITECAVRRPNGDPLPENYVGLRKANKLVRESLPPELRLGVTRFDDWFEMLEGYRHALAHRIPLYIPPYTVDPRDAERYSQLERSMYAAVKSGEMEEAGRLRDEIKDLERFTPVIMHSIGEAAKPLAFHPQLLANFNTIEELGRLFLAALADHRAAACN